ncbi:uncharacterized protein LAESUDRAFT_715178 [Laetiporus sulphureus 93-53]|uniref:C2H2-type domain-containing protein n=1 Tax=Laetiporus sulphureus 93-53 TaxID=1314785 RepID=A0A165DLS1_9APHY|nr:uncharacterized protein LAESUDRAFT_715178 [Laetiporus sulphureus 93-53]KZT05161.1 hypothetical protein LAESUDRAFT_715178 [Laetiporus sulphureus 93-53]
MADLADSTELPTAMAEEGYDEDYDGQYEEGYDDYDAEDIDAEAEAMAFRLQEQLRADIARAQLEAAAAAAQAVPLPAHNTVPLEQSSAFLERKGVPATSTDGAAAAKRRRHDAAIVTMKGILSLASGNPFIHATLSGYNVSGSNNANIVDVFSQCISAGTVSPKVARSLGEALLSLAKSEALFASLRNSDAPVIQLDKGKRKREGSHEVAESPAPKRVAFDQPDLRHLISEAVRTIMRVLAPDSSAPGHHALNGALISSIHVQLHQVFLFAVTSSPRGGQRTAALQELAGLIQMIGVLSSTPIGSHGASPAPAPSTTWSNPYNAPAAPPSSDLGAAVYPCLMPTCTKIFHRLYSLRAHQRLHTLVDRPFRCAHCPASFVRNHDLKRHEKLHERRAWRCSGCGKVFSRRDAIKRHKDSRGRAGGRDGGVEPGIGESTCAYAEIEEVEVEKAVGDEEASRRTKLWNEIVATQLAGALHAAASPADRDAGPPEEGEVDPGVVAEAQTIVLQLHGLLKVYVARGLGHPPPVPGRQLPPPVSHSNQTTLASVIAQSQQFQFQSSPPIAVGPSTAPSTSTMNPVDQGQSTSDAPQSSLSSLPLSEEQTRQLEQAIAQAALAAQAQAEKEAALEERDEGSDFEEGGEEEDASLLFGLFMAQLRHQESIMWMVRVFPHALSIDFRPAVARLSAPRALAGHRTEVGVAAYPTSVSSTSVAPHLLILVLRVAATRRDGSSIREACPNGMIGKIGAAIKQMDSTSSIWCTQSRRGCWFHTTSSSGKNDLVQAREELAGRSRCPLFPLLAKLFLQLAVLQPGVDGDGRQQRCHVHDARQDAYASLRRVPGSALGQPGAAPEVTEEDARCSEETAGVAGVTHDRVRTVGDQGVLLANGCLEGKELAEVPEAAYANHAAGDFEHESDEEWGREADGSWRCAGSERQEGENATGKHAWVATREDGRAFAYCQHPDGKLSGSKLFFRAAG